jgi:hypothetical protein
MRKSKTFDIFPKWLVLAAVLIAITLLSSCEPAPGPVQTPLAGTPIPTTEIKPSTTPVKRPTATPIATQIGIEPEEAFPGAEGFGKYAVGGRGGKVIYVTNLNDSGDGSFREALSESGPRIVEFQVAGTINLEKDIDIDNPFITIAGQTAPGEGVQIKGGMIRILTHEVIIRYLKVREGDPPGGKNAYNTDPISLSAQKGREVYNIMIDHCSLVWGTDIGGLSILTNVHDVTVQDSIIGEGLYYSSHPESPHSKSLNIIRLDTTSQPVRITIYRNLITTSDERNPQVQGAINVDVVDNVIYNWGRKASFGNPKSLNLVNNYYIKGPESTDLPAWDLRLGPEDKVANLGSVYEQGSRLEGITVVRGGPSDIYTSSRFSPYSITNEMTPQAAYDYIVANAGANKPVRDSADQQIINNLINRTGKFLNASDLVWPNLTSGTTPADSDNDGMPDAWEMKYFGDLQKASATSDSNGNGYSDLEEYLNGTNPTQ